LEGDKQDVTYQFSKMMLHCQYPPEEFEQGSSFLQIINNDNSTALLQIFGIEIGVTLSCSYLLTKKR
jgi:hypothetical protein